MDTEPDLLRTMLTPKKDIQAVAPTAGSVLHRFIEAESLPINQYMEAGLAILLFPDEDLDSALVQHRVTTATAHQITFASIPVNPRRYAYHTPTPGPGAA
jgi:hypothetical protein